MPRIRVRSNLLVLVLAATLILPLFLLLQIFLFSPKLVLANPTCTVTLTQNSYGYLVGRATLSPNASYNFGGHLHTGWKLTGIAGSSSGSFTTDGAEPSTPVIYELNHPNIDLPAGNTVNLEAKFYVDQGYYDNDPNAPLFIDATCNASIAVNSLTTFPAYLQGTVQKKEGGVEKFFTNSGGCSVTGSLVSNANSGYTLSWSNGQRGNNMVYGCSTVNPNPALDTSSVPAFFSQYFNNADVNHSNPVSNGQINLSVSMGDTSVNLNRWTLDIYNSARGTKEARIERSFLSPGPNQTITFNATGDGSYKWYTVEVWEDAGGNPTPPPTTTDTGPYITSLTKNQYGSSTTTGAPGITGRLSTQGGSDWLNPLKIKLTAGKGSSEIARHYVAFYDKSGGKITNTDGNFLVSVKNRINQNPKNGFLLRYDTGNTNCKRYYVWVAGGNSSVADTTCGATSGWRDITGTAPTAPFTVLGGEATEIYRVFVARSIFSPNNIEPNSWVITFLEAFGSKSMYTPAYVIDEKGLNAFSEDKN